MGQVTYEGERLITLTLGASTIRTGVLQSLAIYHLRSEAKTDVAMGQIVVFGEALKYTHKAEGLPFALPTRNSTADDMRAAFEAWLDLPEAVGDWWTDEIEKVKQSFLPQTPRMQDVLTSTEGLQSPPPQDDLAKAHRKRSGAKKSSA